jgi:membrane dipeptidase
VTDAADAPSPPIVDAHNDLLLETVVLRGETPRERLFERHWLPRLEAGGISVQICPLYSAIAPAGEARAWAIAQESEFRRAVEENAERVCWVRRRADLDDGRLRLLLSIEGVELLDGDPGSFDEWHERGVRMVSLTWNYATPFAGGIDTPAEGLTDRGRALVRRFPDLGIVLDLAHASEQTWRDVIAEGIPFSVSHACCRAVHDNRRNLADWQLEALAEQGGVLGMMGLAFVVDPDEPTLSRWVDHIDHAVAVMGVEHVGLGADFVDQVAPTIEMLDPAELAELDAIRFDLEGFVAPDDYPALVASLRGRGYADERLEAITGGNWVRVLRETLPA